MFTGVAGFEEGFKKGWPEVKSVGMSEIDKHANQVLRYHYPEVVNYGDAKQIKPEELSDFNILCAGFPCQTFSIAGNRSGFDDARGTLFFEIARIVKVKRPKILLLENVKGLLSHEEGRTFAVILKTLDELGYDAEWQLLNSRHWVPQNRERIFIVGHLRGEPWRAVFPIGGTTRQTKAKRLKEITDKERQGKRVYDTEGLSTTIAAQGGGLGAKTGLYAVKEKLEKEKKRWGDHYKTSEDISPTLMAVGQSDVSNIVIHSLQARSADRPSLKNNPKAGGSGYISKKEEAYCVDTGATQAVEMNTRIRKLTPKECERLQGFPDDWTEYGIDDQGNQEEISDS